MSFTERCMNVSISACIISWNIIQKMIIIHQSTPSIQLFFDHCWVLSLRTRVDLSTWFMNLTLRIECWTIFLDKVTWTPNGRKMKLIVVLCACDKTPVFVPSISFSTLLLHVIQIQLRYMIHIFFSFWSAKVLFLYPTQEYLNALFLLVDLYPIVHASS